MSISPAARNRVLPVKLAGQVVDDEFGGGVVGAPNENGQEQAGGDDCVVGFISHVRR